MRPYHLGGPPPLRDVPEPQQELPSDSVGRSRQSYLYLELLVAYTFSAIHATHYTKRHQFFVRHYQFNSVCLLYRQINGGTLTDSNLLYIE